MFGQFSSGQKGSLDISQQHLPTMACYQLKNQVTANLGQSWRLQITSGNFLRQVGIQMPLEAPPCLDSWGSVIFLFYCHHKSTAHDSMRETSTHLIGLRALYHSCSMLTENRVPFQCFCFINLRLNFRRILSNRNFLSCFLSHIL